MRLLKYAVVFSSLITSAICFAIPPIIISGPTPSIPGHINAGDVSTHIYTITNNVPMSLPLITSPLLPPVSRTTVANDCGNSLPAGPASCNIGITISPTTNDEGKSFLQPFIINNQSRTDSLSFIEFIVPSSPVFVAVGFTTELPTLKTALKKNLRQFPHEYPYIVFNQDGNVNSWSTGLSLNEQDSFDTASCTGSGASALCAAIGGDFLYVSKDAGQTWNKATLPSFSGNSLNSISCIGSGPSAICVAVGQTDQASKSPPIYVSQDGGDNWVLKSAAGLQSTAELDSVSCTGNEGTGICVAVGTDQGPSNAAMVVSSDAGTTWRVTNPGTSSNLSNVSCIGHGSSAICLVGGEHGLRMSNNGGLTWNPISLPSDMQILSVSCTGTQSQNLCVALGTETGQNNILVSLSFPNGMPGIKQIKRADLSFNFSNVNCTGSGQSTLCVAVGNNANSPSQNGQSLLYISNDLGTTWKEPSYTPAPNGNFNSVQCSGIGPSAICVAAGNTSHPQNPSIGPSLLMSQSNDGGETWVDVPFNNPPGGFFGGVGGTE